MGRIGLAVSPADPDVVYAIVEAAEQGRRLLPLDRRRRRTGRSAATTCRAARSTTRRSVADPQVRDRVYSMDTFLQVTDDGGKTFRRAGEKCKHVDNHALWIDPDDTRPPARRLRRRALRDLRPRRDLGLHGQPADHPVLQASRWTTRCRSTTSTAARRTTTRSAARRARTTAHGIRNADWFVTRRRRRLPDRASIPTDPEHRLRRSRSTAGSCASTAGPASASTSSRSRSPGEPRAALELGLAADHQPALAHAALLRGATRSSAATTAATPGRAVSPDLTRQHRPQHSSR